MHGIASTRMAASTSPTLPAEPPSAIATAPPQPRAGPAATPAGPVEVGFGSEAARWLDGLGTELSRYWRNFLVRASTDLAANLRTRPGVARFADAWFPVTVNQRPEDNAYPCSLTTQYVAYPLGELNLVPTRRQRALARLGLHGLQWILALAQADRVVQWNSWLLSTNLVPAGLPPAVGPITRALCRAFPTHAVLLKNLNLAQHAELLRLLVEQGYVLITSRQVYLFDGRTGAFRQRNTVKRDRKFLVEQPHYASVEHHGFSEADLPRVLELYRLLYLDKHSRLNPQYTDAFVSAAWRERWLELRGLRHPSGRLDGVFGCFRMGDVTSTPFIGYDTALPQETGLYRMLVAMLLERVAEEKLLLNYSSGAGDFKRRRGGQASIEFNALYSRHLPAPRRAAFALLGTLANRLGRRFLEENQV